MHLPLVPHPSSPPSSAGIKLWAQVEHSGAFGATATTNIWFGIEAAARDFILPVAEEPRRRDELWRTTCFEAFVRTPGEEAYREWNFAPSGDWAAYDFTGYREGMVNAHVLAPPYVRLEDNLTWWSLGATFTVEAGFAVELGLSAVLEEQDGTKSYWALAHPAEKPDFHNPGCFTARLA